MNDKIFVREFIFLAFLSLTPIFTKIIIYDTNRTTVLAYGILTMIVNVLFMWLSYSVINQKYTSHHDIKRIFKKIYGNHNNFFGSASLAILILSYYFPNQMLIVYMIIPVTSFIHTRHDYTDLEDVTQLTESEQRQFLNTEGANLHELRKKQRDIMRKYRGGRRDDPAMQAELRQLFQSYPELNNKYRNRNQFK